MIQICVGFFSLLCGLAVLVVGHLHPLTARPSPHFTLACIAVSVTAAHNHLLREGAVNNWKAVGTTLPSSGQLVGQLGLVERLVHLPECASWTPALHVACRRCRSEFFGEKKNEGGDSKKREEIAPLAVRRGSCRWHHHFHTLVEPSNNENISKYFQTRKISQNNFSFHTFPGQLILLQVLILSRHFFSGTWS